MSGQDEDNDFLFEEYPMVGMGMWVVIKALEKDKPKFASYVLYTIAEHLEGENNG